MDEHSNRPMTLSQFRRKTGKLGFGDALLFGTMLTAGIAAAVVLTSMGFAPGAVIAIDLGLAAVGAFGYARHQRKRALNEYHAYRSYSKRSGYHREPDYVEDKSLMHLIEGQSDIRERVNFVECNYGVKLKTESQYNAVHDTIGTVISLGLGVGVGMALASAAVGLGFVTGGAAFGLAIGIVTAATALGIMRADSQARYGKYVDKMALEHGANAEQAVARGPAMAPQHPLPPEPYLPEPCPLPPPLRPAPVVIVRQAAPRVVVEPAPAPQVVVVESAPVVKVAEPACAGHAAKIAAQKVEAEQVTGRVC